MSDFHNRHYHAGNAYLIISGCMHKDLIPLLNKHFGEKDWLRPVDLTSGADVPFPAQTGQKTFTEMPGALQNAIRTGTRTIGIAHPDHAGLSVLNTILGGYFGSRLMKNIREDKGYTYGIHSVLAPFHQSGLFYIASETGAEVYKQALEEIYKEIDMLRNEAVPEYELRLVKNYLTGRLLRMVDGPFAIAALTQSLIPFGLSVSHFTERAYETIQRISSYDIISLACKYLDSGTFSEQVAGKK
jgi:predicted Zn-dependent peptidase